MVKLIAYHFNPSQSFFYPCKKQPATENKHITSSPPALTCWSDWIVPHHKPTPTHHRRRWRGYQIKSTILMYQTLKMVSKHACGIESVGSSSSCWLWLWAAFFSSIYLYVKCLFIIGSVRSIQEKIHHPRSDSWYRRRIWLPQ